MSKWITQINLNNYRAFAEPLNLKIPHGTHLLLYGENGSGKSSIYNALKDFFASSANTSIKFKLNRFKASTGANMSSVVC